MEEAFTAKYHLIMSIYIVQYTLFMFNHKAEQCRHYNHYSVSAQNLRSFFSYENIEDLRVMFMHGLREEETGGGEGVYDHV